MPYTVWTFFTLKFVVNLNWCLFEKDPIKIGLIIKSLTTSYMDFCAVRPDWAIFCTLGTFYRHLAIFSGHTAYVPPTMAGKMYIETWLNLTLMPPLTKGYSTRLFGFNLQLQSGVYLTSVQAQFSGQRRRQNWPTGDNLTLSTLPGTPTSPQPGMAQPESAATPYRQRQNKKIGKIWPALEGKSIKA